MRFILGLLLVVVLLAIGAFALGYLDVDQTKEGRLPEVRAEGGQLPGFDVKTGDVDVGTTNTTVEVPKIETEKETIEVPSVEVKKAN